MGNSECGIKRGGCESSPTKDFAGENAKHDLLIENCYGRSFYGLSPKAAAPKGWRGRTESPLLASAEAKSLHESAIL